jgi:hypothetical protein
MSSVHDLGSHFAEYVVAARSTACTCDACGHVLETEPPPASEQERLERLERRAATAYHEAGHICVAAATRAELIGTTIAPYGLFAGRAVYGHEDASSGASIDGIVSTEAGLIAQGRKYPRSHDGSEFDKADIARNLAALCRSPAAAEIVRAHCAARAAHLVDQEWDAIEAVAAALIEHETLTGDQLNELLEDVDIDRANAREPARRAAAREAAQRAAEFEAKFSSSGRAAQPTWSAPCPIP